MNPLILMLAVLGFSTTLMIVVFACIKEKKEAFGFDRNIKDSVIILRLLKYTKPYIKNFIVVLLLMAMTVASDIVLPLIVGDITATLGKEYFEYMEVLSNVLIYVGLLLMSLTCMYFQEVLLQKTGQKIISGIREETFSHMQSLSHEQLNHIPVGTVVTRVCNDSASVSRMFTHIAVNLVRNICLIFGIMVAMFLVNVKLALMSLCVSPFIVLFTVIFRKFSRRAYRRVKNNTTDLNVFLSENLSGIKVTQVFGQENKKLEEFREKNNKLRKSRISEIFVFGVFRPSIYMLYTFTNIALFWIAGNDAMGGVSFAGQLITYSTVVIFYQYIGSFFTPIQNLAEQFNWMQSAFASAEKIFTILDIPPEVVDTEDAEEVDTIKGDIEFKNVWFSYKPDHWILKDLSFNVDAGSTVALVGPTGAGKTTILSLICRNYDIQKGQILIDGRDIKSYKISSLRRHFGQMLQDVFVFSGDIRSNISLSDNFTDEEINEACEQVGADMFISRYEAGLSEPIRERGNNLSAGERQLLSFARTVIHKPEVMILDEATANIDTETEQLIQKSLDHMMNVSTMIIVAHRLSTVQKADKIIVLDHGEIMEQGNHQELLALHGRYYELYKLQYTKEQLIKS